MDLGDASLFPEASVMSLDDRTINSPPEPVAASTVHRPGSAYRSDRIDFLDPRGSFIENHQWPLPESPQDDPRAKKGPVTYMSFSEHIPPSDVDWGNLQNNPSDQNPNLQRDREITPADDRSSLGILPGHMMTDTSFGVGDGPSADLLRFGEESGRVSTQQTDQSKTGTFGGQSSASSSGNSKNLWMGDSANGRQMMATVKRPAALGACDFRSSENEEDPEPSICEVQFEAEELQDLDDEFSDLSVEEEREALNYTSVSLDFEGEGGIEDELCPNEGPLQHDSDLDTEEELEAVRAAMRQSLGDNRQHGVGSSQETDPDVGSDHFSDFQSRHSAEGEVVSPYPDDFTGGVGGDPISESMRFESVGIESYREHHPPQDESCIGRVDENTTQDNPAARTVDASRIDSMYLKPGTVNPGRESELPLGGYGLADDSSCHFFADMTESPQTEERLEAAGFSPPQFEGQNPFGDEASFCPQFDNSLGSFGASPERELPDMVNQGPGRFDEHQSVLAGKSPDFQEVFPEAPVSKHPKDTTKKYISENSPVYLDENGKGVTDLAYQQSFVDEAVYQQEALKTLQVNPQGDDIWPEAFPEDDFMPMENALDMLNEDEKKFQADNIFMKDDKMDVETSGPEDESWILKNSMYLSTSVMQTDLRRHGDACFRISIGQFMRSRSDALGSLGGDDNTDRPSFGKEIITPPSNRPPVKLLNDEKDKPTSPFSVGFHCKDVEQPATNEGPLTMDEITNSNSPPVSSGYRSMETTPHADQFARQSVEGGNLEEFETSKVARLSDMSEVSLSDRTGVLSLSAITDLISSAPENCKSQDLVDKMLALCKAKALEKKSGKNTGKGSDAQPNNSSTTGASVKSKTQASKLPVRKISNSSPKSVETSGRPQKNQSSKLGEPRRSKGSAPSSSSRTPPVGSTKSFTPDRTITITKESNKSRTDGQDSPKSQSYPTVHSKMTGAGDNIQNIEEFGKGTSCKWGTGNHSIGEMIGIDEQHQNQGQEAHSSPVDLATGSSKTSNQKSDSPRLSEIANNMCIDLSKIEVHPDVTLSDSLAVSMVAEKNPTPAEVNKEDRHRDCKKPAKAGQVDSHLFKKPQSMPARKVQATKANPCVSSSGASVLRRTEKPAQGTTSKLTGQARTKTVTHKGPNKENHFNSSKPGIPDKVLEISQTGENMLGRGINRNKPSGRVPNTSLISRKSAGNSSKQIKAVDIASRGDNIAMQSTGANHFQAMEVTETLPSMEVTRPVLISPSSVNSYNIDSLSHGSNSQSPSSEDSRFTDSRLYSEMKTPNAPSDIGCFHPTSQRFTTSQEHCLANTDSAKTENPFHVQHITDTGLLPVTEYNAYMPSDGQNLLTPQNFTTRPRLIDNLVTPARQPSLDGNSMLSFDHGQPAYHSTPFYHALSPCDNSVSNPASPNNTIETEAPRLTEDGGQVKLLDLPSSLTFEETCCVGVSTKTTLLVTNLSQHWVRCIVDVHHLNMNGQPCVLNLPFMFDHSTILEPLSTGSINVIFVPSRKGLYAGRLAVYGKPVSQDPRLQSAYLLPDFVTIEAVAEAPNIKIHTESYLSLKFGDIYRGSSKSLSLTLINNGRCTVPLRLTITATNSSWHCFTFESSSLGDNSTVWASPHNKTILNLLLLGNPEQRADGVSATIDVSCNPPASKYPHVSCSSPLDIIQAKIDIEVDNPSINIPVETIHLQAVVGEVNLQVPTDLEPIELISGGERAVSTFGIKNGGNLKMKVNLMLQEFMSDFLVTPNSITVEPGKSQNVQVTFYPRSRKPLLQTKLFMKIEPSGPQYEAKIIGKYLPETEQAEKALVEILCSKNYVAFGGVEMGKVSCQRLGLLHHSPNRLKLKLEIRCDEPVVFQIKSVLNQKESLTSIKELYVSPHEEYPVYIVFNPKTLKQFKGKLLIKQDGCAKKFSLSLSGYGGSKQLTLDDDYDDSRGRAYYRNINTDLPSFTSEQQFITVGNVGSRAAFVKVICFSDLNCKVVENNIAYVSPDLFVIKAGASQILSLRLNPHSRQFSSCQFKRSLIGVLKFYHGDEVSRILLRRSKCTSPAAILPPNHALLAVDFKVHAVGEENIEQGAELFESSPTDTDKFYKGISRFSLSLFGCPKSAPDTVSVNSTGNYTSLVTNLPHRIATNPANRNRLIGVSPVTYDNPSLYPLPDTLNKQLAARRLAGGLSPPHSHLTAHLGSINPLTALQAGSLSALKSRLQEKLEIYPRQLILDISSNGGSEGHVLISNMSEDQISFELCWPSGKINIDKDSGKVPPRGTCSLTLCPSRQLLSDHISLPWSGVVIIDAQSERKEVSVLIRRGKEEKVTSVWTASTNNTVPAKEGSIISLHNSGAKVKTFKTNPAPAKRSSSLSSPTRTVTSSVQRRSLQKTASDSSLHQRLNSKTQSTKPLSQINSQSTVSQSPTTAAEKIIFTASHIGQATERTLCLSNPTEQPVIWTLSPFTPAYLKVPQSGEVHRIRYDVFKCSRMSGDLQPHETIQVFVQFEPQDIGYFSQFLEVRKREDGETSNQRIEKVQLLAEGLPASSPRVTSLQDQYSLDTTASSACTLLTKQQSTTSCVICLLSDSLSFSVSNPQQTEKKKAQIKNRNSVLHRIEVIPPQPPFYVSHSSLKIRESHYVKLPIDFCPKEKGTFEGIVILKPDYGTSLSLRLKGTCGK